VKQQSVCLSVCHILSLPRSESQEQTGTWCVRSYCRQKLGNILISIIINTVLGSTQIRPVARAPGKPALENLKLNPLLGCYNKGDPLVPPTTCPVANRDSIVTTVFNLRHFVSGAWTEEMTELFGSHLTACNQQSKITVTRREIKTTIEVLTHNPELAHYQASGRLLASFTSLKTRYFKVWGRGSLKIGLNACLVSTGRRLRLRRSATFQLIVYWCLLCLCVSVCLSVQNRITAVSMAGRYLNSF
jgi:hypothetical protein